MNGVPQITFHPSIPWRRVARRSSPAMAKLFGAARLFHFSRDALHAAFRALGPRPGMPVWMPSFHCGMEVRTAIDAGFEARFYRIAPDLSIDEDDLERRLASVPGPVLIIHYFGFVQPGIERLAALCRRHGVPLVEDCSHALGSRHGGREVGGFGAISTFSLYKTLGTLDGGALRIDAKKLGREIVLPPPGRRPLWPWREYLHHKRRRRRSSTLEELRRAFDVRVEAAHRRIFHGEWVYGRGISILSRRLLSTVDPGRVVERRRRNWLEIDTRLRRVSGYRPVYERLAEGACPLHLPIYVRQRSEILVRLQAADVEPFIFGMFHHPAMDPAAFPDSRRMREEILCLPIHQDLGREEIERLASVTGRLLAP